MVGHMHYAGSGQAFGDDGQVLMPSASVEGTVANLLPAVSSIIEATSDPYKKAEILRTKLKRATPGSARYDKLAAKLAAAERKIALQEEGIVSTREWRGLGKILLITGVGVGFSLTFLLLTMALKKR